MSNLIASKRKVPDVLVLEIVKLFKAGESVDTLADYMRRKGFPNRRRWVKEIILGKSRTKVTKMPRCYSILEAMGKHRVTTISELQNTNILPDPEPELDFFKDYAENDTKIQELEENIDL